MTEIKKKALVVDDMSSMRMLVGRVFKEMGFEVVDAKDGEEAWRKLLLDPASFTVICSDWTMPQWTGLDLLKAVRQDHRTKHLPFMLLTAEGELAQIKQAIEAKVDSYVRKPFTAATVKEKVEQLLARKQAA